MLLSEEEDTFRKAWTQLYYDISDKSLAKFFLILYLCTAA